MVEEGPHVGDRDALAQRLDSQGRWLWNAGKRSAPLATSNSDEGAVCALPAGDGGAIFAFEAMPHERERAGDQDLWGQRLNRDGQLLWRKGEYSIGLATSKWLEHSPLLLPDGDGGFFLVFGATGPANTTHAGDEDIQAARFSGGGEPLWNNGEKSVDIAATNALERNPCAITVPAK